MFGAERPQRVSNGGGQVYIQAFVYLILGRTSLHIMKLQIRVRRRGEKGRKSFKWSKKHLVNH